MLSEISQTLKDKYHRISPVKSKIIDLIKKLSVKW